MNFLLRWLINILALAAVMHFVSGISVDNSETVLIAALVLGLLNAFLKPLILALTLPFNIVSFGFLTLIINGFIFYLASKVVEGFRIMSFGDAFWGALLFSIISLFLNFLVNPKFNVNTRFYGRSNQPPKRHREDNKVIDVEAKRVDDEK